MSVYACRRCGAAENRPCVDDKCINRRDRALDFRFHIESYRGHGGDWPNFRFIEWGFELPPPENWREILTAGAD